MTASSHYRSQESSKRQSPDTLKHKKSLKDGKKSEDKEIFQETSRINQKLLLEEFFESTFYKTGMEQYKKLYQKKDLHDSLIDFLIKEVNLLPIFN